MVKASIKKMQYIAEYESINYDKVLIRFPRGTKDRITALGYTVNGFTKDAVKQRLEALEQSQGRNTSDLPAE